MTIANGDVMKLPCMPRLRSVHGWFFLSVVGILTLLIIAIANGVQQVRTQAKNTQCHSNVFFLGHLLLEFGDFYGCLPPPYISDKLGKPLYSWRVLMLASVGHGNAPLYEEFDLTKPWDDPTNLKLCKGQDKRSFMLFFACPTSHPQRLQADYFYALSSQDRWPRDFLYDYKSRFRPAHVLLVERQTPEVHWSEPVDVVYEEPGMKGLLAKIAECKAPHIVGTFCYVSDAAVVTIPPDSTLEYVVQNLKSSARMPRSDDASTKEELARLVARWMDILGDRNPMAAKYTRQNALLLLGELGPTAKAAAPMIRQLLAEEQDARLKQVAAFALTKIER